MTDVDHNGQKWTINADHTELISDGETWREIKRRINHLLDQGYTLKIGYDRDVIVVYRGLHE